MLDAGSFKILDMSCSGVIVCVANTVGFVWLVLECDVFMYSWVLVES
jgi:hypothetical protein